MLFCGEASADTHTEFLKWNVHMFDENGWIKFVSSRGVHVRRPESFLALFYLQQTDIVLNHIKLNRLSGFRLFFIVFLLSTYIHTDAHIKNQ